MKKTRLLFLLGLLISMQTVFANGGIGYKGIYINNNGTKTWYKVHNVAWSYSGCTDYSFNGASDFSGVNFGTLTSSQTFQISGFAVVGWTDNTDWVAGKLLYKIWKQGDTEPGTWTEISVGNYGNGNGATQVTCSSGNDRVVGYNNGTTNINPGAPGVYNFKAQGLGRMQWSGGNFNPNDGAEVTATFTITSSATDYFRSKSSGNWNTTGSWESSSNNTNWAASTLIPGSSAAAITVLNGHNITLDANVSVSGLTINSGATFTASDATARTLTISKSASGSSTTLANSGNWANGTGGSTVVFTGAPGSGDAVHAITGTIAFQNLTVNKTGGTSNVGVSFGTGSSLTGTLEIGTGGFVATAPPSGFYNSAAILKFNQGTGAVYDVNSGDYSWSTTQVPQNITITSGTVNLNADRTASGNLLINGGTLVLNNNTPNLTIQGNWTRSSGAFTANSGTVTLSGTSDGTVDVAGSSTMNNFVIAKTTGAKAILACNLTAASLNVNLGAILTVNAGKQLTVSGTLTNNGTLNLLSSVSGSATLLTPGTISGSGTAKVEQYLSSYRSWYMSSPVSGSVTPSDNNSATPALLQWYDETKGDPNGWTTATQMTAGKGYMLNPGTTSGASTLSFSGTLSNSDVAVNLTRSSVTKTGFNLIGNPYPAHIVWANEMATSANLLPSMWYRTAVYDSGSGKNIYSFNTYNSAGSVSVPVEATPYIPPMQAFWVRVDDTHTTGQLVFTKNMCHHKDGNALKAPAAMNSENQVLRIKAGNGNAVDETLVYFNANASNAYDTYDSPKIMNGETSLSPDLYTLAGDEQLVINGMNTIPAEIPLYIKPNASASGQFSLTATEVSNFEAGTKVYIKNSKTGELQLISDGSVYNFDVKSNPTLSIIIKAPGTVTGIGNNPDNTTMNVYANAKGQITVVMPSVKEGDVARVFNSAGQCILNQTLTNTRTLMNKFFTAGVYVVKVNDTIRKVVIE